MKVAGIIAEYNPFHKGHKYQLDRIKAELDVDYCIVIMSGDFVQRGEPAIIGKYERAQMALISGADLVIELPTLFSTASAEYFAESSVAILDKLGIVDYLCFGSESGDIRVLTDIASILVEEPSEYKNLLQAELKSGASFPKAREKAIISFLSNITNSDCSKFADTISSPNNLLGIEYIKALQKRNSKIIPYTILRTGSNYLDEQISDSEYSSALSIRKVLDSNYSISIDNPISSLDKASSYILYDTIKNGRGPVSVDHFSHLLHVKLLQLDSVVLTEYADISQELSNRIYNNINNYENYSEFCSLLKTKELTYSRISRSLMHIILDCMQKDLDTYKAQDYAKYAHVLGFRAASTALLSEIKRSGNIPLLSKVADAKNILSASDLSLFEHSIRCSQVYESMLHQLYKSKMQNMYQQSPIII